MAGITLKKLSELSGLSIRTVNRALKDQPEVSEANRKLVRQLAEKYNYLPDMAARNFRLRRRNIVGILTCDRLANEALLQKISDLERNLIAADCYPVLGCSRDRDIRLILREWHGIVGPVVSFCSPAPADGLAGLLENDPLSFIFVDCKPPDPRCHSISIDRSAGIADAYRAMVAAGCRRILHCGSISGRVETVDRIASEELAGKAEFLRIFAVGELEEGYRRAPEIVAARCDAVFFDTDRMAAGFYRYAGEHGIRIPEDIRVVGFDDDPVSQLLPPPLSSVAHPVEEISRTVMEIISNPPEHPVRRVFPSHFLPRESFGRR